MSNRKETGSQAASSKKNQYRYPKRVVRPLMVLLVLVFLAIGPFVYGAEMLGTKTETASNTEKDGQ